MQGETGAKHFENDNLEFNKDNKSREVPLKVLFITNEVTPFSRTDESGDFAQELPKAVKALGHEIRLITPRYKTIRDRRFGLREVARLKSLQIDYNNRNHDCSVKSGFIVGSRVQVYFLDHEKFYNSPGTPNNVEELLLLAHCAIQLSLLLNWIPDVIHCNGWQTSLVPYLMKDYPAYAEKFSGTRSIFQLYGLENHIAYPPDNSVEIGLTKKTPGTRHPLVSNGEISLLKPGVVFSDKVVCSNVKSIDRTNSVFNILKAGLRKTGKSIIEIQNGIDTKTWDPSQDKHLVQKFSADDFIEGKLSNKQEVLSELKLGEGADSPLIVIASEAEDELNQAIIKELLERLNEFEGKFIILGSVKSSLLKLIEKKALEEPGKIAPGLKSDKFKHRAVAAADIFLLPMLDENCECYLVYSLMYGSVPIAAESDITREKISPYSRKTGSGNGFLFDARDSKAMFDALDTAISLYPKDADWQQLQSTCMQEDFSWCRTAEQYIELYEEILDPNSGEN